MCLYPTIIKNPKYKKNKKNGGEIPAVSDKRVLYVPIGCQKCMECRKQKKREWQIRLLEDIKTNKNGHFITLTFSNESITELSKEIPKELEGYDIDNAIATLAMRRFLERWRKEYKKSVRHWMVTELGHKNTEHLHMHGIIWTDEKTEQIRKHWKYGYIWDGYEKKRTYVNDATVNYITKYIHKVDKIHKEYKSIILTSPGIGGNYTNTINSRNNKFKEGETDETYRTRSGHKIAMPIYWRNKIYSEKEREELWIQKLDKNERWINGERIDISQGEEEYYKVLEWHRIRNKTLGYGSTEQTWEQSEYEKMRRNLKIQERIQRK